MYPLVTKFFRVNLKPQRIKVSETSETFLSDFSTTLVGTYANFPRRKLLTKHTIDVPRREYNLHVVHSYNHPFLDGFRREGLILHGTWVTLAGNTPSTSSLTTPFRSDETGPDPRASRFGEGTDVLFPSPRGNEYTHVFMT